MKIAPAPQHVLLLLLLAQLIGCTGLQPFPGYARPGDTIAIAAGSADGMTQSNTTVTFQYYSDGSTVDLTTGVRSIFKLYADPVSSIYFPSFFDISQIVGTSGHEPWINIITVDLPANMEDGTGNTAGSGQILVNTSAAYPTVGSHINDLQSNSLNIKLQILDFPGGTPALFPYEAGVGGFSDGDLTRLEPVGHTLIHPAFLGAGFNSPWPSYGAIELKIDLFADSTLDSSSIRVVSDDMQVHTESLRSVASGLSTDNIDPELTVILTSLIGKLEYFEARFALVPQHGANFTTPPIITSASYFDVDGNPVTGPAISDYTVLMQ